MANPNNCRAYIECQQNLRLDRECRIGDLFDEQRGACGSQSFVHCGGRLLPNNDNIVNTRNVRFSTFK